MSLTTETVWSDFQAALWRFIRSRVRDDATADDLLQESFLRIHQKLSSLKEPGKLNAWVHQIVRHVIADHYRQRRPGTGLPELAEPGAAADLSPELMDCARQALLARLPDIYREALELTDFGELSQKQLAEQLGLSFSGAKSRVQRGRELMAKTLLECCRLHFDHGGGLQDFQCLDEAQCLLPDLQ